MHIRCPQGFQGAIPFLHTFCLTLLLGTVTETEVGQSALLGRRLSVQWALGVSEIEIEIDIRLPKHTLRIRTSKGKVRVRRRRNGLSRPVLRQPPPLLLLGLKIPLRRLLPSLAQHTGLVRGRAMVKPLFPRHRQSLLSPLTTMADLLLLLDHYLLLRVLEGEH